MAENVDMTSGWQVLRLQIDQWRVCIAPEMHTPMQSRIFTINHFNNSKWQLEVTPASLQNGTNNFICSVVRCHDDSPLESIRMLVIFKLTVNGERIVKSKLIGCAFRRGKRFTISNLITTEKLIEKLQNTVDEKLYAEVHLKMLETLA